MNAKQIREFVRAETSIDVRVKPQGPGHQFIAYPTSARFKIPAWFRLLAIRTMTKEPDMQFRDQCPGIWEEGVTLTAFQWGQLAALCESFRDPHGCIRIPPPQ